MHLIIDGYEGDITKMWDMETVRSFLTEYPDNLGMTRITDPNVIEYNGPIEAPISKGDKIGLLNIYVAGELKRKIDIFSNEDIKKTNVFSRLLRSFNYLVWGDV